MKSLEAIPSDYPITGVFIATILANGNDAFSGAMAEDITSDVPIDQRPINNLELCESLAIEAAYTSTEGDDLEERRMIFRRALWWPQAIAKQCALPEPLLPCLEETPTGERLDPDVRMKTILKGGYEALNRYNNIGPYAKDAYAFVDPQGKHPTLGKFGVLAGFYLLDNGERAKRRKSEQYERRMRQYRKALQYSCIDDDEVMAQLAQMELDFTGNSFGSQLFD